MAGVAPTPVQPTEAARRLRTLSRGVRDTTARLSASNTLGVSETRKANAAHSRAAAARYQDRAAIALTSLRESVKTRRVVEINAGIDTLMMNVSRERMMLVEAYTIILSAVTAPSKTSGNGLNAVEITDLQMRVQQIVDLVQSLPTVEDLPSGNMENMLRAIMAILRTGGFPGAADLKWEEVKKHAETQANNNGAETSVVAELKPEPIPF